MNLYAFDRGYDDYMWNKPTVVYRTVKGNLRWRFDNSMLEEPEVYAKSYIEGQASAHATWCELIADIAECPEKY